MHICIIAPEQFPLPGDGSVEICIWNIARLLAVSHKVTVISRTTDQLPYSDELEQVRIIRLASGNPRLYRASVLKFLEEESFDIIQVDNRPQLMAAVKERNPDTPVLLYLHSLTFVPAEHRTSRCLAFADSIAVNSRSLQEKLSRRFPGVHRKLSIIPLGADLSRFAPAQLQERQHLRRLYRLPNVFTVLFAGRVIPRKGVPVLIRAMYHVNKRLPAHLIVAGQGKPAYIRQLRQLARRLGVSVSFPGKIAHEQIHGLYQAVDCFVCPSQRHEAFGLVNVEAMASGLPVIASDNGGIREIIRSGHNGYLAARYREALPFARLLLKIGRHPALAAKIGLQGRSDALRTFEWRHTAYRLEKLYHSLLHS